MLTEIQRVNDFPSKLGNGLHFPDKLYDAQSVVSHFLVASVYLQDLFNPHVNESPDALEQVVNALQVPANRSVAVAAAVKTHIELSVPPAAQEILFL